MRIWGLLGRVATVAHTTEQNFLIGSFAKLEIFHCLSTRFSPQTILLHTYQTSTSHFMHEYSNIQYQGYSTMGEMKAQNEMDIGSGIM